MFNMIFYVVVHNVYIYIYIIIFIHDLGMWTNILSFAIDILYLLSPTTDICYENFPSGYMLQPIFNTLRATTYTN